MKVRGSLVQGLLWSCAPPIRHMADRCLAVCLRRCRKGEVACCEEIKAFAVKHNIKQQQIAVLAGLCHL